MRLCILLYISCHFILQLHASCPRGGIAIEPAVLDFGLVNYKSELTAAFSICNFYDRTVLPSHPYDYRHYRIKYYKNSIHPDSCMKAWIAIKPDKKGLVEWKIPFYVYGEQDTAYLTVRANVQSFDPMQSMHINHLSYQEEQAQASQMQLVFVDEATGQPIPDVIPFITKITAPRNPVKSNEKGVYKYNISQSYKLSVVKYGYETIDEIVHFPCDKTSLTIKLKANAVTNGVYQHQHTRLLTQSEEARIHLTHPSKGSSTHQAILKKPLDSLYKINNLVFLIDVSSSMYGKNLDLVKQSLHQLIEILRPKDKISLVTFSAKAKVVLPPTYISEKKSINRIIKILKCEGLTDENEGIKLAYEDALTNYLPHGNNQIILLSDGGFNSQSKHEQTISIAQKHKEKIKFTIMAFHPSAFLVPYLKEIVLEGGGHFLEVNDATDTTLYLLEEIKYNSMKE